jgi:ATP-dependent Clp protease ATP-binding subunit ClpA
MLTLGGAGTRLFIVMGLIAIAAASRQLAYFLVAFAWILLIGLVAYKGIYQGRFLPRFVLDMIDRRERARREAARKEIKITTIDADDLAAKLKARVVGQDDVIDRAARTLRRRLAARRPNKPVAVFCFAGPPGVGKTQLAKVLAETLYGDPRHLHFIDMSQNSATTLFGSPKGYVGSGTYGSVTAALREVPNSIMLLDEFEKAEPEVHKRFLTAWNDGFITETSDGAKISTSETIFILTTNAAARRIGELARGHSGDPESLDRMVKSALGDAKFAPEVLSRIDEVFPFREMRGLDIARVVALEIEGITRQYDMEIAHGGIDPQILLNAIESASLESAKAGVREISRNIEKKIADGLVDARLSGASHVRFEADGERIRVVPITSGQQSDGNPTPVPAAI